jgi:hypothetical protein
MTKVLHVVCAPDGDKPHPADVVLVLLPDDADPYALLADGLRTAADHEAEPQRRDLLAAMGRRFGQFRGRVEQPPLPRIDGGPG